MTLAASGIRRPDPSKLAPRENTKAWYGWKAWEELYAAEGSDWFWWYGDDQTAPGGDKPFDLGYLTHLRNVYAFARKGRAHDIEWPNFQPIIHDSKPQKPEANENNHGVMAK